MDTGRIRSELVTSLRFTVTEERWLLGGLLVAPLAYGFWVGVTGAALTYAAAFAGISITIDPWTGTTTAIAGIVAVLWVLAPAAVVTYYLPTKLINHHDNLEKYYRFRHPLVLVLPALALFVAVASVGAARGAIAEPLAVVLIVLGIVVLVRTVVYSYRVFSLSAPRLLLAFVFATAAVQAVTVVASAGVLAGRREIVRAIADGIGGLIGGDGLGSVTTGSTTVGGVAVPTLLGVAAGVPVTLSVLYLTVQLIGSLVTRIRKPAVPRGQLRTGQRYPEFAQPGSGTDTSGSTGEETGGDAGRTPEPTAESDPEAITDTAGEPGHTRVFVHPDGPKTGDGSDGAGTSPEDRDAIDPARSGSSNEETAVLGGGYACPSCGDRFPGDVDFTFCPACGTELESTGE